MKPKLELTPEQRLTQFGEEMTALLKKYDCRLFPVLKVGHVFSPLKEIGGFEVVVQGALNDSKAQPKDG